METIAVPGIHKSFTNADVEQNDKMNVNKIGERVSQRLQNSYNKNVAKIKWDREMVDDSHVFGSNDPYKNTNLGQLQNIKPVNQCITMSYNEI